MSELTLPPVAKSFYAFCKKCNADRYHVVLAHTSATAAKIECEVCKSKKTFSLPKKTASGTKRVSTAGAKAASARANSHRGEYELRLKKTDSATAAPYSMKAAFTDNQKIQHPKFGIGFIQKSQNDRIDVIFEDEVRTLLHNKN